MKFLDEYRDADVAGRYLKEIERVTRGSWKLMEMCGGQTHAIVKFGIDELLPKGLQLIHGPGCPVCVTPIEIIDKALEIAARPEVTFCSFGDMLRVPGSNRDLLWVKANGGQVRIVYSPLDALKIAEQQPDRQVVFFAVGFETTAPATALAVYQAAQRKLNNFTMLVSHVLVPPAIEAILDSSDCQVNGFLAAGHVCTVMGYEEYLPIADRHHVPIVVTGFEPVDILQGILMCIQQLEQGRSVVENQYSRSVRPEGNATAQRLMNQVFQIVPRKWRGIGEIPRSGLGLRPEFALFDAQERFGAAQMLPDETSECQSGLVLRGKIKPAACPAFGVRCTPEHPLGATMVSSEGACAAYYRYRRQAGA